MEQIPKLIEKYRAKVAELNKDLITFGYLEEDAAYQQTLGEKAAYQEIIKDLINLPQSAKH